MAFFQVAKLISSEDLDKFDRLQLNNALNGMGDVVYCPRPGCNQAVIKEPDGDIAQCFCGYVFCSICRHGSHGVEPCRFESTLGRTYHLNQRTITIAEIFYRSKQYRPFNARPRLLSVRLKQFLVLIISVSFGLLL